MTPATAAHSAGNASFEVQSGSTGTPQPSVPKTDAHGEASTTGVGYSTERTPAEKQSSATLIPIELLYQAREARSAAFNRALALLSEADQSLSEAQAAAEDGLTAVCALHLMTFEDLLQPLFECREVGECFANVINTIHFGIANLKDEPLGPDQASTIWRVIRELSVAPFLSFAESLEKVRQLRKVGISVNNAFIDEWTSEAGEGGQE